MPCREEIHVADIGTVFRATYLDDCDPRTVADVSGATTQQFTFTKPDGSTIVRTTVYTPISQGGTGDGTDGKVQYTTVSGDLDQAGRWKVQGYIVTGSGEWRSVIIEFYVHANS